MRILHCPTIVGGNAQELARAERALGLESWAVSFEPSTFAYEVDEVLWDPRWGFGRRQWTRLGLLRRALRDFDVIHFNFGSPILPMLPPPAARGEGPRGWARAMVRALWAPFAFGDLALLRAAGKAIFVTYQGDDARQGDYSLANFDVCIAREVGADYYSPPVDRARRERIARFDQFADGIFALNPDLLHVLPPRAEFLAYSHIDLRDWAPVPPREGHVPVVVHAPSHQGAKGTRFVLDAVERLRAEGVAFEFRLIQGMTRAEARHAYEGADILIDQLLAGWYGGLAVELMALGKPVVCYLRDGDLGFLPPEMRAELPIIPASPTSIVDVLREWLTVRRPQLAEQGRRSRAYVERWHDPRQIAAQMKERYAAALARHAQPAR